MEHRWSVRKPLATVAGVFQRGKPVLRVLTRNISTEGLCVDEGPLPFPVHTPLEVELALPVDGRSQLFRLSAFLVHNSSKTAGLMFLASDTQTFRAFRQAVAALANSPPPLAEERPRLTG
jgi:hypothetical protein